MRGMEENPDVYVFELERGDFLPMPKEWGDNVPLDLKYRWREHWVLVNGVPVSKELVANMVEDGVATVYDVIGAFRHELHVTKRGMWFMPEELRPHS